MDALPAWIWKTLQHKKAYPFNSPIKFAFFWLISFAVIAFVAHTLVLNDRTWANTMTQDFFIFVDGTYRVSQGSVPHLDFVTSLGALNFYGPYWCSGNQLMLAIPRFVGCMSILLILFACYLATTRLNQFFAYAFMAFITILAASPNNLGAPKTDITFAMFYNRLGYALLVNMVILMLPPLKADRWKTLFEGVLTGISLLLLLHLKITFFLAGLAIVGATFMVVPSLRTSMILGVTLMLAGVAWIEFHLPHFYEAYWHDLTDASASRLGEGSELGKRTVELLGRTHLELLLVIPALILVWSNRTRIPNAGLMCCFYLAVTAGSIPLILLNYQDAHLILPVVIVLHATMLLYRHWLDAGTEGEFRQFAVLGTIALYLLVSFVDERATPLDRYRRHSHTALQSMPVPKSLENIVVEEGSKRPSLLTYFKKNNIQIPVSKIKELSLMVGAKQEIIQTDYLYTIVAGSQELDNLMKANGTGPVVTFDFANPFPAILNLPVGTKDYLWMHPYVNISAEHHLPAKDVLQSAQYVAIPKYPVFTDASNLAKTLYLGYVSKNFKLAASTPLWQFWVRDISQASRTKPDAQRNIGS